MTRSFAKFAFCGAVVALAVSGSLRGQGIQDAWSQSLTAMKAQKWSEAHAILARVCSAYDKRAALLFGPKFGWFWYHKGYCELKLKRWGDAMKSFEHCYKKYPNNARGPDKAGDAINISFNHYHKKALLKWGDAAVGAEDYETAIRMYKKFLAERDPKRDTYERGAFYINLALSYFKLENLPEGIRNLEVAITNKEEFPTPDAGIMVAFRALVEAVIETSKEPVLIDFLSKNRAHIKLAPFRMHRYANIFMKLAADALSAEMLRAAFELYALVPSTRGAIDDIRARLAQVGPVDREFADPPESQNIIHKKVMEEDLETLQARLSSGDPYEVVALAATAYIHEQHGNVRGAYACYEILERFYNKSKAREKHLYNLVRTSALIGEVLVTERYGSLFLKVFPNSKHVESVRSMMLTSLFLEAEYEKCIEVATVMLPKLASPSKQHDICLHVLGGSYYYTGKFDMAQELLDEHAKTYPESQFRTAALYFQASNLSRLQYWSRAAKLLDEFLAEYPDPKQNAFLPFALYDRANCHYAEEELDPALVKLNRIESEFPGAAIMEMAFNLKGNVLETQGEFDQAEQYYLKGLELAERKENRIVASESLFYLVALLGAEKRGKEKNPRVGDAVPYYDKFWQEYESDSPYKAQVAVAGVHALKEAGRIREALERLQGVITELAVTKGAFGLEEAINSYTEAYLEEYSAEKLKEHYYNFPGIDARNREAQALLRIALITVFEDRARSAEKEKEEEALRQANAMVKVLFEDLKNDFNPPQLSNYILVRLGDYLREKTAAPRQAVPYYREVIDREDQAYRFSAYFGLADILGGSSEPAETEEALRSLEHVFKNAPKRSRQEAALYRIMTVLAKRGDWEKVTERAKQYLTTEGYRKFAGYASLLLADSYRQRDMREDAIAAYSNTLGAFAGMIEVSAPAVKWMMKLTWERNKPGVNGGKSDRQVAYETGWNYCDSTRHIRNGSQIKEHEIELWDEVLALVQRYENDPVVMNMEEVKKREEELRRRRGGR